MNEDVVFSANKNQSVQEPQVPSQPVSVSPPPPPILPEQPSQPLDQPPVEKNLEPSPVSPELEDGSPGFFSSFPIGAIVKGIIGLFIILIVVFLAVSFIGPRLGQKTNQKATINYWGLWEDSHIMQSVISDFQKQNPNITVNYTKQDIKQYRERLSTRIQNGTGPDIFRFHNTWFPMFSGVLLPLPNDTVNKSEFQKSYYPVIQSDLVKNGAVYGIPLEIDTLSLFVNTEILKASGVLPPATWDDFNKASRALTVKDENGKIKTSGTAMGTFDNVTHAPDIMSLLFIQNGANLKNLVSTSQNASDALNFYTSFAMGEGNVWDETLDPSILAFSKGNLAMYFGYSYDVFAIKAMNSNISFQVLPVPRLPGRKMTIASYWAEGVNAKSKFQKEALLFLNFLAKKETQQKIFSEESKTRLFGEPYSRIDLLDSLKNNDLVYVFAAQGKDAVSSFFASNTFDNGINSQMNGYLGNAVRSILGNTSAQSAVETLSKGVSQVLQQYGQ